MISTGAPSRPTFGWYLRHKLGREGGRRAWFNFFIRPFGATSFSGFWRSWNPVYGYFLHYHAYRPLAPLLGRRNAMLVTFALCGFVLHDAPAWVVTRRVLPPGATIAFTFFGLGAILGDAFRMNTSAWPPVARAGTNAGYLAGCVGAMLLVLRKTGAWR